MTIHRDNRTVKALSPGTKINRLTSLGECGVNAHRHRLFKFKCDCGNEKVILGRDVLRGRAKSCGCLELEKLAQRNYIHALSLKPLKEKSANAQHCVYLNYKRQDHSSLPALDLS